MKMSVALLPCDRIRLVNTGAHAVDPPPTPTLAGIVCVCLLQHVFFAVAPPRSPTLYLCFSPCRRARAPQTPNSTALPVQRPVIRRDGSPGGSVSASCDHLGSCWSVCSLCWGCGNWYPLLARSRGPCPYPCLLFSPRRDLEQGAGRASHGGGPQRRRQSFGAGMLPF